MFVDFFFKKFVICGDGAKSQSMHSILVISAVYRKQNNYNGEPNHKTLQ